MFQPEQEESLFFRITIPEVTVEQIEQLWKLVIEKEVKQGRTDGHSFEGKHTGGCVEICWYLLVIGILTVSFALDRLLTVAMLLTLSLQPQC